MIGDIIKAGSNLVSGWMGREAAKDAQSAQHDAAKSQYENQKEFAQQGIRWKVADARAAGIHPLYAIGSSGASYSPVTQSFASDNSLGKSFADAGQNIGDAINRTRTSTERDEAFAKTVQALTVKEKDLDIQIKTAALASAVSKIRASSNPPMPPIPEDTKLKDRPPLFMGGDKWKTDPGTSNMEQWEDRGGDEGPYNWAASAGVLWNDIKANYGEPHTWPHHIMNQFMKRAFGFVPGQGHVKSKGILE